MFVLNDDRAPGVVDPLEALYHFCSLFKIHGIRHNLLNQIFLKLNMKLTVFIIIDRSIRNDRRRM